MQKVKQFALLCALLAGCAASHDDRSSDRTLETGDCSVRIANYCDEHSECGSVRETCCRNDRGTLDCETLQQSDGADAGTAGSVVP